MRRSYFSTFIFLFLSSATAETNPKLICESRYLLEDSVFSFEPICSESGVIEQRNIYFKKNNIRAHLETFENGKIKHLLMRNSDGVAVAEFYFTHLSEGSFIKTQVKLGTQKILSQSEYSGQAEYGGNPSETKRWSVDDGVLTEMNVLDLKSGEVSERVFLDKSGKQTQKARFFYKTQPKSFVSYINKMEIFDSSGRLTGTFDKDETLDIPSLIRKHSASEAEFEKLVSKYESRREPIVVIDTGFDVSHPDLTHKMYKNPLDPVDGIDNDNNGWVDDVFGWDITTNSNNIRDNILRPSHGLPYSHGTHVASIALRDVEKFALIGLAGNMAHSGLLMRTKKFLSDHKVKFVNMSFGWEQGGEQNSPFVPGSDVSYALENLIEGSPQTLFVVAAGNEYSEMSYKGYCALPVCLPYSNMLRVGALNVAGYSKSELENSSRADFSNYGTETVDIFAPGELVVAAGIGNQQVAFSGTSMASPNALNIILKMKEISETQNIQTLKEILMKSAYIENISSPMPCKSGGKIFPERAYAVLRQLSKSPHLSIEESVLLVRKQGLLLKGEDHSPKTIEKLREIWSKF